MFVKKEIGRVFEIEVKLKKYLRERSAKISTPDVGTPAAPDTSKRPNPFDSSAAPSKKAKHDLDEVGIHQAVNTLHL